MSSKKRASRVVRSLVLAALAGGRTYSTGELARAASPPERGRPLDGREVRRACEELREEGLVFTAGEGRAARHSSSPLPPAFAPASPANDPGKPGRRPGEATRERASRGTVEEELNSSPRAGKHQRNGCCCCAGDPGLSGDLFSVALDLVRRVLRWLEGRVSPENGACSCSRPSTASPCSEPSRASAATAPSPPRSGSASRSDAPRGPAPAPAGELTRTSSSEGAAPSAAEVSPLPRVESPRVDPPHWSRERAERQRVVEADEAVSKGKKVWTTSRADWIAGMKKKITPEEIRDANRRADEAEQLASLPPATVTPTAKRPWEADDVPDRPALLEQLRALAKASRPATGPT